MPSSTLAIVAIYLGFALLELWRSNLFRKTEQTRDDGIVEAVESPDHGWVIGVQFRPELRLEEPPHFDRLFQSLVERADARSD